MADVTQGVPGETPGVPGVRQGTFGKAPVTPGKTQGTPDEALGMTERPPSDKNMTRGRPVRPNGPGERSPGHLRPQADALGGEMTSPVRPGRSRDCFGVSDRGRGGVPSGRG